MMQQRPVIAILTANVLVGVGLRSILEKAAPAADVELFGNFQEFAEADPERFIHYFVTAQLFAAHNAFFRARSHRTIVLANGQTPAGVHCIDVQTDEERFVRSLMRLQHSVRRPEHALPVQPQAPVFQSPFPLAAGDGDRNLQQRTRTGKRNVKPFRFTRSQSERHFFSGPDHPGGF